MQVIIISNDCLEFYSLLYFNETYSLLHFSLKENQYLDTNGFLEAVREEFERNWSK